jgi:hypothetical protein
MGARCLLFGKIMPPHASAKSVGPAAMSNKRQRFQLTHFNVGECSMFGRAFRVQHDLLFPAPTIRRLGK